MYILSYRRFEQAFLNSLISAKNGPVSQFYWTALQDQNRTGSYRWLMQNGSTTPLTYTNWNRHQPCESAVLSLTLLLSLIAGMFLCMFPYHTIYYALNSRLYNCVTVKSKLFIQNSELTLRFRDLKHGHCAVVRN